MADLLTGQVRGIADRTAGVLMGTVAAHYAFVIGGRLRRSIVLVSFLLLFATGLRVGALLRARVATVGILICILGIGTSGVAGRA